MKRKDGSIPFAELNDRVLVRLSGRRPEAFACLYRRYYQPVFNYLYRRTLDVNVAQDLTANTFFSALKSLPGFRWFRRASFSSWIYRIATNEVNMHYRRKARMPAVVSLDALPDAEALLFHAGGETVLRKPAGDEEEPATGDYRRLHAALLRLPSPYQTVFSLRFFAGKKISEIARITGRSEGTVKSQLHRGLEQLRQSLKSEATFPGDRHYKGEGKD